MRLIAATVFLSLAVPLAAAQATAPAPDPSQTHSQASAASTQQGLPGQPGPAPAAPPNKANKQPQQWSPVYGRCREAVRSRNLRQAEDLCKEAVDLAQSVAQAAETQSAQAQPAGPQVSGRQAAESQKSANDAPAAQIALLQSWETYGQALLDVGRGPEAMDAENHAVDIAQAHLHPTDQEYGMPFYWRALVESHFHNGEAASADLAVAEDTYRKAMDASPRMKPIYRGYLATILRQHAALLDAMGKPQDAEKLRTEAGAL